MAGAQLNFWESWSYFYLVHVTTLDTTIQIILYAACATVQGLKIKSFFRSKMRRYLKPLAWLGLVFSCVIFCLFVSHIIFLIWYPGKKYLAILGMTSMIWSSCLMLPLIHYMVARHKKHKP